MLGIAAKTRGHAEGSMWLKKNIIGSSGSVALQNLLRLWDNARQHGSIEERDQANKHGHSAVEVKSIREHTALQ